jgi:hypothetical protein
MSDQVVPLILEPNGAALIILRDEALEAYSHYLGYELTHESDRRLFAALAIALGTMSKPALVYGADESSYAVNKIAQWRK